MPDNRATLPAIEVKRPEDLVRIRNLWEKVAVLLLDLAELECDLRSTSTKCAVHDARMAARAMFAALAKADKLETT